MGCCLCDLFSVVFHVQFHAKVQLHLSTSSSAVSRFFPPATEKMRTHIHIIELRYSID